MAGEGEGGVLEGCICQKTVLPEPGVPPCKSDDLPQHGGVGGDCKSFANPSSVSHGGAAR